MSKAPFLPIRDLVIFPNVVTPIYVGRANSIATLEKAIANKTKLVLGLQKDASQENPTFDGDIYEVGVIANIVQIIRMPNNNIKVLVEAENRVKIKNIEKEEKYIEIFEKIARKSYPKLLENYEKYIDDELEDEEVEEYEDKMDEIMGKYSLKEFEKFLDKVKLK